MFFPILFCCLIWNFNTFLQGKKVLKPKLNMIRKNVVYVVKLLNWMSVVIKVDLFIRIEIFIII